MTRALARRTVRSFSANERWVRLPPLRRNLWNVGWREAQAVRCPCVPPSDEDLLERKVCGWRHARLENGMPSGAGFDSYAFREQMSSKRRTAGVWLRATPRPGPGRRATVIKGPANAGATPAICSHSGCSSVGERVVGDDEAAGAIPATQTHAPVPWIGTQVREACWQRFDSSQWHHMRRGLGNRAGLQIRLTVRFDS